MCILAVVSGASHEFPFICFHNREELRSRPTGPVEMRNGIISGVDLQAGGTWMGFNAVSHRFVALTNWRSRISPPPNKVSRGLLVSRLLEGADPTDVLVTANYEGFNVICASLDLDQAGSGSGSGDEAGPDVSYLRVQPNYVTGEWEKRGLSEVGSTLEKGGSVHCVSNAGLNDTSWPKVRLSLSP